MGLNRLVHAPEAVIAVAAPVASGFTAQIDPTTPPDRGSWQTLSRRLGPLPLLLIGMVALAVLRGVVS